MGMFDMVYCHYPLPDCPAELALPGEEWQTKDFDQTLTDYTITAEGRLIKHEVDRVWEPNEGSIFGGYLVPVAKRDIDTNYHGVFNFYSNLGEEYTPENWYEYTAKFTDGQLVSVTRFQRDPRTNT